MLETVLSPEILGGLGLSLFSLMVNPRLLTGSSFAHCQLTLPTILRNILNIGSIRHDIFKASGE